MVVEDSLKICTVCASNNNRSMESHKQLKDAGYNVKSFGTGSAVRLPGPSADKPNVYEFGTPYEDIYNDLISQNCRKIYEANGLIHMLDRNRHVKTAPEKWQNNAYAGKFDLVITCEERCFDSVLDDLMYRMYSKADENDVKQIVHVINVDIKDDNENALIGGKGILKLVNMVHEFRSKKKVEGEDESTVLLEDQMMNILTEWQKNHTHLPTLYSVSYY
ncbi:Ssu72-like protein [Suhomyces tanzawaensis NRRL Y-17324]|uniref:RNA polymerase II subunit A C-terminal domain phosphatase SSU72 n=1 Tax=Suhomyces tanzawaensis NRRL Y-17324 TaxID=984487 RepID=A0A1E4SIV7_9ASCO|nr:Ssu72-like protein [Suhomyces tanzawaensis NRRL Y-17324]ODV79434.1 Ssu72-like protein [Suhomyces tanzawaensis NRRL Y-17324]